MQAKEYFKQNWPLFKTFRDGYETFLETGKTPVAAYHAMRQLYCKTNGRLNDIFQFFYALKHPYRPIANKSSKVLPGFGAADCSKAVQALNRDGYYIFPTKVPEAYLDELMRYSFEAPAILQTDAGGRTDSQERFDPHNLIASNYRFAESGVINVPAVQKIMADPALLSIAQQYIASEILFVNIQMWWTTPFGCTQPSSRLAQMFHFDMDRIKFMKYFLYLTDVGPNDGPHCYIRGSCKRKPEGTLEDRRFSDEELAQRFPAQEFKEICGPRGTLLAVDTRGFHKAKVPTSGNRLILQLEIANSLFGCDYVHPELELKTTELQAAYNRDPSIYRNYKLKEKTAAPDRQPALV